MSFLALTLEKKESIPLIEFQFGSMSVYVTTSRSVINWQGRKYIPEPALEVKLPKQGITLEEEPCVVTLPTRQSQHPGVSMLALILAQTRAAPPLTMKVMSLLKASEDVQEVIYLYEGTLDKRRRNPKGKQSCIELEFLPELIANLDDITLGRRADPECDWIFGEVGCYVQGKNDPFTPAGSYSRVVRFAYVTANFSAIANSREVDLTLHQPSHPGITNNDPITSQPIDWWLMAFLTDGYTRIPIQEWRWNSISQTATNTFVLNRVPPSS